MSHYVSLCLTMSPCRQANPPRVNGRDPKSFAEQVNEKFLLAREDKLCSKEAVSVLEAWNRRPDKQACHS